MSLTAAYLDEIKTTSDSGSPYSSAGNATPTAGRVLWIGVANAVASGTADTVSVAGYGATWTQVSTQTFNSALKRVTLFWGYAASYTQGNFTVTMAGTPTGLVATAWETSETHTADADVQFNTASGTGTTAATTLTGSTGAVMVFASCASTSAMSLTDFTGIRAGAGISTPTMSAIACYKAAGGDDSPDATCPSSVTWGIVAAEVRASVAAGFGINGVRLGFGGRWRRPAAVGG